MIIRNQSLLRRPWLFPVYTVLGVLIGLYFGGDAVRVLNNLTVILIGVACIAALNVWFFASLRQTLRELKRVPVEALGNPRP